MFAGMMGGQHDSPQSCWKSMAFSYKFYFLTSLGIFFISFIIPISYYLMSIPVLTVYSLNLWRPFFAFWANIPSLLSIINILFAFLWMMRMLDDKNKSTVYNLLEVFFVNMKIHLLFTVVSLLLTVAFSVQNKLFGYGWFPLILVFEFHRSAQNPQAQRQLCCLPFLIKNKHFPWVISIFLVLLSMQPVCMLCAMFIGYMEAYKLKRKFIEVPNKLITFVENCLPSDVKNRPDYVYHGRAQLPNQNQQFNSVFGRSQQPNVQSNQNNNNNPFNRNQNNGAEQVNKVNALSGASMAIGGNNHAMSYKDIWKLRQQEEEKKNRHQKQSQIEKEQYQIEPNQGEYQQFSEEKKKNRNKKGANKDSYQNLHQESIESNEINADKKPQEQSPDDLL